MVEIRDCANERCPNRFSVPSAKSPKRFCCHECGKAARRRGQPILDARRHRQALLSKAMAHKKAS